MSAMDGQQDPCFLPRLTPGRPPKRLRRAVRRVARMARRTRDRASHSVSRHVLAEVLREKHVKHAAREARAAGDVKTQQVLLHAHEASVLLGPGELVLVRLAPVVPVLSRQTACACYALVPAGAARIP